MNACQPRLLPESSQVQEVVLDQLQLYQAHWQKVNRLISLEYSKEIQSEQVNNEWDDIEWLALHMPTLLLIYPCQTLQKVLYLESTACKTLSKLAPSMQDCAPIADVDDDRQNLPMAAERPDSQAEGSSCDQDVFRFNEHRHKFSNEVAAYRKDTNFP